jgi:hypothetical protein
MQKTVNYRETRQSEITLLYIYDYEQNYSTAQYRSQNSEKYKIMHSIGLHHEEMNRVMKEWIVQESKTVEDHEGLKRSLKNEGVWDCSFCM